MTALRALQARILAHAQASPPAKAAVPLLLGMHRVGSMAVAVAHYLDQNLKEFHLEEGTLRLDDAAMDEQGRTQCLQLAARRLQDAGFIGAWRSEELEVRANPDGAPLARIDRSAVRVLGITTCSAHCNGYMADGRLLVAQRAAHKRIDPGMWDNLAGGMIAAGESVRQALARETFEEAGIRIEGLPLRSGSRICVRRPIPEGELAEVVHVFDLDLPAGTRAVNQDGEVARFSAQPIPAVLAAIERGQFTVEAALATLESLLRRGYD